MNRGCEIFSPFVLVLAPISLSLLIAHPPAEAESITPAIDGTGTIVTPAGNQFTITGGQLSGNGANLFHSFQQFGLDQTQTATFLSNPAIQNILGRVVGGSPSVINGLLQVTGGNANLFLMNPAGIVFGPSARLNVPGSFLATTANGMGFGCGAVGAGCSAWFNAAGMNDYAALVGNPGALAFTMAQPATVINAGNLAVGQGQNLSLIGGTVVSTGSLTAPGGQITLAAVPGENLVRLNQQGSLLSLEFSPLPPSPPSPLPSSFSIPSLPQLLTGGDLSNATDLRVNESGQVELTRSQVQIPTNPGSTVVSGTVDVSGQTGGKVHVLGDRIGLIGANINASGIGDGGTVLIGGDYKGQGTVPNATRTYVSRDSDINANSTLNGNGGRVIVWADGVAGFYGSISARGGSQSGNGGFAEVSGKQHLIFDGMVELSAANGNAGTLLLDPTNILISNVVVDSPGVSGALPDIFQGDFSGQTITISQATLEDIAGDQNIILEATNNITLGTLDRGRLSFNRIFDPTTGQFITGFGTGNITFRADADGDGNGVFSMNPGDWIEAQNQPNQPTGRTISISGASLTLGSIRSTGFPAPGGSVVLSASGNISVGTIRTNADSDENIPNPFNGGDISITSTGGRIDVNGGLFTDAAQGNSGNVTLEAFGNITTSGIIAFPVFDGESGGKITIRSLSGAVDTSKVGRDDIYGGNVSGIISVGSKASGSIIIQAAEDIKTARIITNTTDKAGSITLISGKNIDTTNGELNSASANGASGAITLEAVGSIRTGNITSGAIGGSGGTISLKAGNNIDTTQGFLNASSGVGSGDVSLSAGGSLAVGAISTRSDNTDPTVTANAGNVSLIATGDITISNVIATSVNLNGTGDAGDITIISTDGSMTAARLATTPVSGASGVLDTGTARGNGGDILVQARKDISIADGIVSYVVNAAGNRGNAGDITLISLDGSINTALGVNNQLNASSATEAGGTGGNVRLRAARDITTASVVSGSNIGSGGSIELTSSGGAIDTTAGTLDTGVSNAVNNASAGAITLEADGNIRTGNLFANVMGDPTRAQGSGGTISLNSVTGTIDTTGQVAAVSTNGAGGAITLKGISITLNGPVTLGSQGGQGGGALTFTTFSNLRLPDQITSNGAAIISVLPLLSLTGLPSGTSITTNGGSVVLPFATEATLADNIAIATNGGNITITSPQNLTILGTLNSASATLAGGNITLVSDTGAVTTPDLTATGVSRGGDVTVLAATEIRTGRINTSATQGNGGNVFLDPTGNVEVGWINAQGGAAGRGGTVDITTQRFFLARETFTALNGRTASISTIGGLGGGDITIRHDGGARFTPFNVTNLIDNGTVGVLTTGNETIAFGRFPGPYTQGNIRLITSPQPIRPPEGSPQDRLDLDNTGTLFPLEELYTREFERYDDRLGETKVLTLEEMQATLRRVEDNTGVKPALIYVSFAPVPSSMPTDCEPGASIPDPDNPGKTKLCECKPVELPDDPDGWDKTLIEHEPLPCDRLTLTLVTGSGKPIYIPLSKVPRHKILILAEQFRATVENRESLEDDYRVSGRQLYQWLVKPLREVLQDNKIDNLSFLLPAQLRLLPFAALTDDSQRFLIETYSTGLMPSLSLVDLRKVDIKNTQILAMGASEFKPELDQKPLPYAEEEVIAITPDLWRGRRFLNQDFTFSNLASNRYGMIHLATHGQFNSDFPKGIIYLWDQTLSPEDIRSLNWNSPPVEMLVLSACRTTYGSNASELGFAGAAHRLGVKSILGSLWLVEDQGTSELMQAFYKQLPGAPIKGDALAQAQQAMLQSKFNHPHYWSAFTLVGNPW